MTPNDHSSTAFSAHAAGRSSELAAVREAYQGACHGTVRLLLIDGPSATGKRALLDAWLRGHRAGPVLRIDAGSPRAVESIVERALDQLSPVRRARHAAQALLTHARPATPVVDLLALAERRLRLREEVQSLLGELGADNPAVVLLEGLHDASRGTLELLSELVAPSPFAARPQVLFIATVDGAPSGRLAELLRGETTRTLTLRPLDREGIRAFLASRDVVDAVLALTGGHPEVIERLLAGGLRPDGPQSPATREALEVVAVAERPLEDTTLRSLVPGFEESSLTRAGAVLGDGGWTLPPRDRTSVRATMEPARLGAVHDLLTNALSPARGARHALAAERLELATTLALEGADELTRDNALVDAADLLLDITRAHDAPPIGLRRRLVEALWIAGDHADAIEHARDYADHSPAGALLLGRLLALAGRRAEALRVLEAALASVDLATRPLAEAALAEARYGSGDLDGAEALALKAQAAADPALALDAENTRAKVAMARGELERAEQILSVVLARSDAAGLARPACQSLNNLAIIAMSRGELGAATEHLERMLALANADGAVFFRGIAHKNLAVVSQLEGAWDSALRHSQRALELLGGLGNTSLLARLSFNTADLHRSLGDPYRSLRLCAHARELAGEQLEPAVHGEGLRVEAATCLELGRREDAERAWTEALEIAVRLGQIGPDDEARLGLASVALDAGDADRARALLDAVRDEEASARTRARVALTRARLQTDDSRVPLARSAVDAAERTCDPLLVQIAHVEVAHALLDAGLPERAREELGAIRRRERDLMTRVPEALRQLFSERSVVRRLASLEQALSSVRPHGAATPASTPASTGPAASGPPMVGESAQMRRLRTWIERVGPTNSAVLITGESGTGKELVAEALHAASPRAERPFVRVNCAALVDTLLSSELFGHERGAFTGADRRRLGRFELADGGTLLLDEIGDISPRMQAALLRVLQDQTFERVGGTKTQRVDVRLIAATHRDLTKLVAEGRFREDLFYRLSGITVRVPSLRERPSDLPALCRHLLGRIAKQSGTPIKVLAPDALERLAEHHWPGNIRELENALSSAAVLSPQELLTASDFEAIAPSASPRVGSIGTESLGALMYERVRDGDGSIYEVRKRLERELIERALGESQGNISKAAELLGMKRPRLSKLVNEWGLKK